MTATRTKITNAGAVDINGNGQYSVVAETAFGERFILAGFGGTHARCEAMADRILAKGSIDADLWLDHWPVYGSTAYEAQAEEGYMAAEMVRGGYAHEADFPDAIRTLL